MAFLSLIGIGGALFDDRDLLGAPIWMKPLTFMISFALYTGTLAWTLSLQTKARRLGLVDEHRGRRRARLRDGAVRRTGRGPRPAARKIRGRDEDDTDMTRR
jgi:hypothetical protein